MKVKLKKSPLSLAETAKRLGVSRARARNILRIVDANRVKRRIKTGASNGEHASRNGTRTKVAALGGGSPVTLVTREPLRA